MVILLYFITFFKIKLTNIFCYRAWVYVSLSSIWQNGTKNNGNLELIETIFYLQNIIKYLKTYTTVNFYVEVIIINDFESAAKNIIKQSELKTKENRKDFDT